MKLSQARAALMETDRDTLEELIDRFGDELVAEYQEQGCSLGDMEEAYQGEYKSDVDFAQNMADDLGAIDKDLSWPYTGIDWEWAARQLMMDYFEVNGHYFRSL